MRTYQALKRGQTRYYLVAREDVVVSEVPSPLLCPQPPHLQFAINKLARPKCIKIDTAVTSELQRFDHLRPLGVQLAGPFATLAP